MIYKIISWFKRLFKIGQGVPTKTDAGGSPTPVGPSASVNLFIPVRLNGLEFNGRKKKFYDAIEYSEARLFSKEFKDWFMAFQFTQLGDYEGYSNEQLYVRLLRPVKSNYSVIPSGIFNRSTIGYNQDDPNTEGGDIFTYQRWYDSFDVQDLADQLVHEWVCHGNGFSHDFYYSQERDSSVPYAVGTWVGSKQ